MLRNSARDFLQAECPTSYVRDMEEDERGFSPRMWEAMAGLGWLGLIAPERCGGEGMGAMELAILLEEMGGAMLPGPYFSTVVMAGVAIAEAGSEEQKREYLSRIARGQLIATLGFTEPGGEWDASGIRTTASRRADGDEYGDGREYVIDGVKLFTPNAHVADIIIVAARTGDADTDVGMFVVNAGADGLMQTPLRTIASDKQSELAFDGVRATALGDPRDGWEATRRALEWGAVGKCAEMLGGAQRTLDMTLEYAKTRIQFGRAVGSFQAVQHHAANMAADVEGCRYITYKAAWALDEGLSAASDVAVAKAWVSAAAQRVAALAHQCHGAIGFTKEHDLQLYSRRAKAAELMFGDADFHLETVASSMGL